MEKTDELDSHTKALSEEVPSLLQNIASRAVSGFDIVYSPRGEPSMDHVSAPGSTSSIYNNCNTEILLSPIQALTHQLSQKRIGHQRKKSISMPSSPSAFDAENAKRDIFRDRPGEGAGHDIHEQEDQPTGSAATEGKYYKKSRFYSQPMQSGNPYPEPSLEGQGAVSWHEILKSKQFDNFKTWSGKLERQLPHFLGKHLDREDDIISQENTTTEAVPPVERYFEALEGPQLEILRISEELVLPKDKKWPFLLRFPISSFGICLGVSSQAILWKMMATSPSMSFIHVSLVINLVLWCISLALTGLMSFIYTLKLIFYFEAVRREYYHPIRVNFFFAPWIACLFLAIGVPPCFTKNLNSVVWYVLMTPILCLELKLYGQWMSGGDRRLSRVANPTNHISIVSNFVVALLGANIGLREGPIFFFAVGLAHYIVLFVTLYQRLPSNETLPRDLHPVFFLFVAGPSAACTAWANISGDFDYGSKMAYFVALFLYFSLVVRVNFFCGFRFSLAWWAYTTPMTGAAIASIRYSNEMKNLLTQTLAMTQSAISTITVSALLVSTIVHAFVLHDLFPNDVSIAITDRPLRSKKWQTYFTRASSKANDVEVGLEDT